MSLVKLTPEIGRFDRGFSPFSSVPPSKLNHDSFFLILSDLLLTANAVKQQMRDCGKEFLQVGVVRVTCVGNL
jgi:hypothetical protein